MFQFLYHGFEELFAWFDKTSKKSCYTYCELESADNNTDLINQDGSLLSVLEIHGIQQIMDSDDYDFLIQKVTETLTPLQQKPGYVVKFVFRYDPDLAVKEINTALSPAKAVASRLQFDLDDFFTHSSDRLSKLCNLEKCYLCIWTTNDILSPTQKKQSYKTKLKAIKQSHHFKMSESVQKTQHVMTEIRQSHQIIVSMVQEMLESAGVKNTLLNVREVLKIIRHQICPSEAADTWQAHLPGDPLYPLDDQWIHWLWPSLSRQLFVEDAENIGTNSCRVGDYIYAPIAINLFPKETKSFYQLFRLLRDYNMPWQISFCLSSGGLQISKSKALLAQFLSFSSHENKLIYNAHQMLKYMQQNGDTPIVKYSISLMTWANCGEEKLLADRRIGLSKSIQAWGGGSGM